MNKNNNRSALPAGRFVGVGVLSAVAASLCCITPVLALISGASGVASTFSWMEPARPYLISLTVLVLAFVWYQKLKRRTADEIQCDCETNEKKPFMQTKTFLGIVTVFATLMLAFPYYSPIFYPTSNAEKQIVYVSDSNVSELTYYIQGMTCAGCEAHIENEVNKLEGVLKVDANFGTSEAFVKFDKSKVSAEEITSVIEKTGYKIIE